MCTLVASSDGTLAPQSCTVPTSLPKGAYTLTGTDGAVKATTAFTLNPGVTVLGFNGSAAQAVAAGQTLGLTGSGFASTSTIKATFNGVNAPLTPATLTNSSGQFSGATFVVPAATVAGNYAVTGKDASGNVATVHLDVLATTLTVTPTPGVAGTQVGFTGSGFPTNDLLTILLVRGVTQSFMCQITTDANGSLAQTCAVPTGLAHGAYTVVADDGSLAASTSFTLNPGVTVLGFNGSAALRAAAGQKLGIQGNGFAPGVAVHATFNGVSAPLTPATTTNAVGTFSGSTFVVPAATAAGRYPVVAKDASGDTATIRVDVYAATLKPTPSPGISGRTVTLTGAGWPSNEVLTILLVQGTTNNFMCQVTTDGNGSISQSCTVPTGLAKGAYTLVGEDGALAVSTPFTLNPGVTVSGFNGSAAVRVAAGQTLGLAGSGFAAGSAIHATFNGVSAPLSPATTTNTVGAFSGSTFVVPAATVAGSYALVVKDGSANTVTVHLTVYAATLKVTPSPSVSGNSVSLTGTGWPSNDSISLSLVQGTTRNFMCSATTDGNGSLSTACAVPTFLAAGSYSLLGADSWLSVSTPFTLHPGVVIQSSTGQPLASAPPGTSARLVGNGFASTSTITKVTMGTKVITFSPAIVTSTAGSFPATAFTVPSIAAGTYTVTVKDAAGNTGTAQFTVS
jgi:5-hydroxyisourate hydrolase-like protein (transthyretin family)